MWSFTMRPVDNSCVYLQWKLSDTDSKPWHGKKYCNYPLIYRSTIIPLNIQTDKQLTQIV